jgi:hypothetical protein
MKSKETFHLQTFSLQHFPSLAQPKEHGSRAAMGLCTRLDKLDLSYSLIPYKDKKLLFGVKYKVDWQLLRSSALSGAAGAFFDCRFGLLVSAQNASAV